jgi:uncharacterized protein (DUF2141 family)
MNSVRQVVICSIFSIAGLMVLPGCKHAAVVEKTGSKPVTATVLDEQPANADIKPKADSALQKVPLTLVIENLASATGEVIIGVYGAQNKFPDPKGQLKEYRFKPHGKTLTAKITGLKFGTYALALYQDVNGNGKIDKNLIGIPKEGYAFSNNFKPTIKAPVFNDCSFDYNASANSITMTIIQ